MMIFDFDGVLMDSIDEVVVTGYNAVTDRRLTTLDDVPETVAARFRQNRFHLRNSADLFALMDWCVAVDGESSDRVSENERLDRSEFAAVLEKTPLPASERSSRLFAARDAFMEHDRDAWMRLHRPFQPIWNELAGGLAHPIVILTSKNHAAIVALCLFFNLEITPENVYAGDGGTDKTTNLKIIHERFGRPSYRFIDDAIGNLRQLGADFNTGDPSIELILAGWGYVGPDDAAEAERLGYRVLRRPTVASLIRSGRE